MKPEEKQMRQEQANNLRDEVKDLKVILNKTGDLIDQKEEAIKYLEND